MCGAKPTYLARTSDTLPEWAAENQPSLAKYHVPKEAVAFEDVLVVRTDDEQQSSKGEMVVAFKGAGGEMNASPR